MNTETSTQTSSTGYAVPADYAPWFKATKFVSWYSTAAEPNKFMQAEHRSEKAAQKGSWQSPAMKAVWIYRGYVAV